MCSSASLIGATNMWLSRPSGPVFGMQSCLAIIWKPVFRPMGATVWDLTSVRFLHRYYGGGRCRSLPECSKKKKKTGSPKLAGKKYGEAHIR